MRDPPEHRPPDELLQFGVVNLDKPAGPSAHQVAGWVRDLCDDALRAGTDGPGTDGPGTDGPGTDGPGTDGPGTDGPGTDGADGGRGSIDRAAHGGTLDPKVTGCLPVLIGNGVRLAQVFEDAVKEYVAVLELHGPTPGDFRSVAESFEGPIYQKPPRRSAVVRELRVRTIHELEVLELEERRALLRIECESGTYVRKLCHDLGLALGTGAHMGHLRRTRTGVFDDTDLVTLHDLADALAFWTEDGDADPLRAVVDPAERALADLPSVTIAVSAAREVANGAPVYAPGVLDVAGVGTGDEGRAGASGGDDAAPPRVAPEEDEGDAPLVACYTPEGTAVCIGRLVGDPDANEGTVVALERVLL